MSDSPPKKTKDDLIATKIIELSHSGIESETDADPHAGVGLSQEATVIANVDNGPAVKEQVAFQVARPSARLYKSEAAAQVESNIGLADNLRMVQSRLQQVESELDRVLKENESVQSELDSAKKFSQEMQAQAERYEAERSEILENHSAELQALKESLAEAQKNNKKLKSQNDHLEERLSQDFRKIRIRERELENRLEIAKIEKEALIRTKDEVILDLKRKLDEAGAEISTYRNRVNELGKAVDQNNQQVIRTVRTLRLALSNLEGADLAAKPHLKKAE